MLTKAVKVIGVDLYPPPHDTVPPNCFFEVDDISVRTSHSRNSHIKQLLMRGRNNGPGSINSILCMLVP